MRLKIWLIGPNWYGFTLGRCRPSCNLPMHLEGKAFKNFLRFFMFILLIIYSWLLKNGAFSAFFFNFLTFFLLFLCTVTALKQPASRDVSGSRMQQYRSSSRSERTLFVDTESQNVTVAPGDRAVLNCRVQQLGAKTVRWISAAEIWAFSPYNGKYTISDAPLLWTESDTIPCLRKHHIKTSKHKFSCKMCIGKTKIILGWRITISNNGSNSYNRPNIHV